jgi:hypothetical protein
MRMFISAIALSLGLTAGGISAGSYGLSSTVLDPAALDKATSSLLSDQASSTEIVNQLDNIMGVAVDAGVAANGDPAFAASVADKRAQVRAAAQSALNDPQMRDAIKRSLASLQSNVGTLNDATATVQGAAVARTAKTELAKQDPALAAQLPNELNPITISATQAKSSSSWMDVVRGMAGKAALIALGLLGVALLFAPNRAALLRRMGRWAMVVGGIPVLMFAVLPSYVLPHLGSIGGALGGFLQGSSANIVAPSSVLAACGLFLFVATGAIVKRNAMLGALARN